MADRNILLIAYYFPPLGMGGVGRPLALFRYLPVCGYKVHVVTVKNIVYPEYDYTLLDETNIDRVHRTGSIDPSRLLYLAGIRRQSGYSGSGKKNWLPVYPDMKRSWVPFAAKKTQKLMDTIDFDAVITTSPPPSAHLVGLTLKQKYKIPWIADFRDFWFSRPIEEVYSSLGRIKHANDLKDEIIHTADNIVCTSHEIKKYLGRGEVVHNAADAGTGELWKKGVTETGDFVIGVLGTVNDLCPIEPLFKALDKVRKVDNKLLNNLSIVHVGYGDRELLLKQATQYKLDGNIVFCGYLPREKAVERLAVVNLLYMGIQDFGQHHILPGRIFDYLVSGKPVLGMVPRDSDADHLLNKYPFGASFAPDDTDNAAHFLIGLINGTTEFTESQYDASLYTHEKLAADYAGLIERLIGKSE